MDDRYRKYFLEMLEKYNNGTATSEQIEFLEKFYDAFELNDELITNTNEAEFSDLKTSIKTKADQRIDEYIKVKKTKVKTLWYKYSAAAAIILFFGIYILVVKRNKAIQNTRLTQLIHPGKDKATLTLSNGSKIFLDDAKQGQIARQSNISVTKITGNQLVYLVTGDQTDAGKNQNANQLQNTISTPNGGQYRLVLPDGTHVMLNAASSLTYPVSFQGGERLVKLTGEAYFEVIENPKMPFRVSSGGQTVEDLGTHFNINAYNDEAVIKTTLLEGAVRVSSGLDFIQLVPGQQSLISYGGAGKIVTRIVDVDKETAWKDGLFSFQNDDLKTVMRQVARWYDVKVVYADQLPKEKFFGEIPRSSNLDDVFKILELNNVHFEIEGKTVTVSAK